MTPQRPEPAAAKPKPVPPPMPGRGTLLTYGAQGYAINAPRDGLSTDHPFKARRSAGGLIFSKGLVEAFEPKINGVPISGRAGANPPVLRLAAGVAVNGESWACIELTPNAEGRADARSNVKMVHTAHPESLDEGVARHPVVLIIWRSGTASQLIQNLERNCRYQRVKLPLNKGPARHLFF